MEKINERIVLLRKILKIKQNEFATKIGLTASAVSYIEAGKTPLTESNIKLICYEFNVREKWLRTGEGEMFNPAQPNALLQEIYEIYNQLSPRAQKMVLEYVEKLYQDESELKKTSAAAQNQNAV